ncbi:hypothetical protein [Poriferisphaera sp. WC338]|uniref:hypothetical protein n=1 Tax=Poriferisphaera sp. WC338 TaxID=3425129 RepID=UPI003D813A5B
MAWFEWQQVKMWLPIGYGPTMIGVLVLLWLGFRGKRRWGKVHCKKCGEDLSMRWPEDGDVCNGNDGKCGQKLGKERGYRIGKGFNKQLIIMAILLAILPWGGMIAYGYLRHIQMASSGGSYRFRIVEDAELINAIQTNFQDYQLWQQLKDRAKNGQLDQTEVDLAAVEIIAAIKATGQAQRFRLPEHYITEFVKNSRDHGTLSNAKLFEIAKVWWAGQWNADSMNSYYDSDANLIVDVYFDYQQFYDFQSLLRMVPVIESVSIDGQLIEVEVLRLVKHHAKLKLKNHKLAKGKRQVVITSRLVVFDVGAGWGLSTDEDGWEHMENIDPADMVGSFGEWQESVTGTITVVP